MNHEHHQIGAAAARLADRLPHSVMMVLAGAVAIHGSLEQAAARQAILHSLPTPDFRDATADFLDLWHSSAASVGAEAVAVALLTAANCELDHRHEETVEIVWTGPEPAETRFRQTEQAILEVVNSATRRLTVVSYAVYRIPRIREALVAAANRGVGIRLIVGRILVRLARHSRRFAGFEPRDSPPVPGRAVDSKKDCWPQTLVRRQLPHYRPKCFLMNASVNWDDPPRPMPV